MLFVKYTRNGMKRTYYVSIRYRSSVSTSQERSQLHRPTMIYLSRLAKAENNLGPCAVQNSIKSKAETNILSDILGYCKLRKYLKISQGYTVSACICHYFLALFWITTCHREVLLRKWSIWTSLGWCWHTSCASFVVQGLHGASNRAIGARNKTITNGTNQKSIQDDLHGDLIKTHIKKVPFYILSIYFYAFLPLRKMLPKPIWKLKAVLWQ